MRISEELIPTRKSLLSRLKNLEDQESWRLFFDTYWKLIYKTAVCAGLNDAEAQDVVQETVIAISKHIQGFQYDPARGSFKGYLMRMTHWRIADQFRKRLPLQSSKLRPEPRTKSEEGEELAAPVPPALEAIWDQEWENNLWEAAVRRTKAKTDPKLYQAFDLYVHQKWPAARVANDLKITRARVYLAKHLVGKILKSEVSRLQKHTI